MQRTIRHRFAASKGRIVVQKELLAATDTLRRLYRQRNYKPAWLSGSCAQSEASRLVNVVARIGEDGLRPSDYHYEALMRGLDSLQKTCRQRDAAVLAAELDLLLSDAFLLVAAHLHAGRVDPVRFEPEWHAKRKHLDGVAELETALSTSVAVVLDRLRPHTAGYHALKKVLTKHGGANTRTETTAATSALPAARKAKILVNLERWRWLPQQLGARYVWVNVPTFEARLIESGRTALSMRVVAGKRYRRTPMIASTIGAVTLSPQWQVPHRIAVEDLAPRIARGPDFLQKNGIVVLRSQDGSEKPVDASTINWSKATLENFPLPFAANAQQQQPAWPHQVHFSQSVQRLPP